MYPYDIYEYTIESTNGKFSIDNNKARLISQGNGKCKIEIVTSKKGSFNLVYTTGENMIYTLPVRILSL